MAKMLGDIFRSGYFFYCFHQVQNINLFGKYLYWKIFVPLLLP